MSTISVEEVQALCGITGNDAIIRMQIDVAEELLYNLLGVSSLESHSVTHEEVRIDNPYYLTLEEFPVDVSSVSLVDCDYEAITQVLTFELAPRARRRLRAIDSDGEPTAIEYSRVYASYTAGYTTQSTITILVNPTAGDKIIIYEIGTDTEYQFVASGATSNQINIGTTKEDTASNIATKLNCSVSSSTVTLPLGYKATLSTGLTATDMTITNYTFPDSLKMCLALIAGAGISKQSNVGGDISELKIDDKTIKYRGTEREKNTLETVLGYYISVFRKPVVREI